MRKKINLTIDSIFKDEHGNQRTADEINEEQQILSKLTLKPWKQDAKRVRGCRMASLVAIIWMLFILVT